MTALHNASEGGHVECVRLLLDRGAAVNAVDVSSSRVAQCGLARYAASVAGLSRESECASQTLLRNSIHSGWVFSTIMTGPLMTVWSCIELCIISALITAVCRATA